MMGVVCKARGQASRIEIAFRSTVKNFQGSLNCLNTGGLLWKKAMPAALIISSK
jgi:hypothetical protein